MKILHTSAECYPAAKVGGLADVVGSLPKYLRQKEVDARVVIPKYQTEWIQNQQFETVFKDDAMLGDDSFSFVVERESGNSLGFPFYVVDIPERFERNGIYGDPKSGVGYRDEAERFISFQIAVLEWVKSMPELPDLIHCHDHHTALIPFIITQCAGYTSLSSIPTILTVHNADYQGIFPHQKESLLPDFNSMNAGLLDWDGNFNSLAAGLKCCWKISTVSPTYMRELTHQSNGLELLFDHEQQKSTGILNGIDESTWDPEADAYLDFTYSAKNIAEGKGNNKQALCDRFGFDPERPLIAFIGRLVDQKGADLLPGVFSRFMTDNQDVSFLVLGTGEQYLHDQFNRLSNEFIGFFDASLNYNEKLAHQIYAGSDFMLIPSRFEPCGLNQLYAMRYGTVPVVREVGGLKDTVIDIEEEKGYGITFEQFSEEAVASALLRSVHLYRNQEMFKKVRKKVMALNFSWDLSAKKYIEMYSELIDKAYG